MSLRLAERLGAVDAVTEAKRRTRSRLRQLSEAKLESLLSVRSGNEALDESQLQALVFAALDLVLAAENSPMAASEVADLVQEILDDRLGNGPLQSLLRDDSVTEIMVARFDRVYVERAGTVARSDSSFESEAQLRKTIERMVSQSGRRVDESNPMVDARLADGSRINVVLPPIAVDGATLTVRKFAAERLNLQVLVASGSVTSTIAEWLVSAVRSRRNIVVGGGTGSGKSTLVNVLSEFVSTTERVVTIEDSAELQLQCEHVVRLESRLPNSEGVGFISIRDLVRNALRMRPDRIIVGEVRDGAALDMLQAMNTGHDGCFTTVHANSPEDALKRIETMCLMTELQLPIKAIREQIASALDVVVHLERDALGFRRITKVIEILGIKNDGYLLHEVVA